MDKEDLKKKMEKNNLGRSLLAAWRIWRNPEYWQWLKDYELHTVFKFQELGPYNSDKALYFIGDNLYGTTGFFCLWAWVCRGLIVAERYGFTPVADWTKTAYYDEEGWNGIKNPFEYYFEPLSPVTAEEARESKNVTFCNEHTYGEPFQIYGHRDDEEIERFARINSKYIHIKDELYEGIKEEICDLLGNKSTLAVHIRGVEWGNMNGHPVPASYDDYARKIENALKKYNYKQIFLATDSEDTVTFFREKYGDAIVCYSNAVRASSGSRVLPIFKNDSERRNNGFWLGYEVLRDMLTLSFCDGLVAGYSYVSFAAQVFKRSRGEDYLSRDFVDQQVCSEKNAPSKEIKKLLNKEKLNVH